MKKIIYLRSNPVNPDSRVEKEVFSLKEYGYNVEILSWDRKENYNSKEEKIIRNNLEVSITRKGIKGSYGGGIKKNLIPLLKFQAFILYFLIKKRKEIGVVHACDFDTGLVALLFTKIFEKKLVYDIFDYYSDSFNIPLILKQVILKLDSLVIKKADAIILCSEKRREQLQGVTPKKEIIIHNTPDDIIKKYLLKKEENRNNDRKVRIVYVGVLLKKERMIEELLHIVSKNKKYELHIGGFGELEKYIEEMANKFKNIIYYGKISYLETLELESNCDIITALYDPKKKNHLYAAPNKFYEALMLEKPIVMVKNTGMSEIISEYNIGELVDYTQESLAKGLERLVSRREEWKEIARKENYIYKKYYSWNRMKRRLLKLYQKINVEI